jgi:hypothetical protein
MDEGVKNETTDRNPFGISEYPISFNLYQVILLGPLQEK